MWLEAGHWNIMITMLWGGSLTLTLGRGWPAHGPDFLVNDPVMENLLVFFVFPSKCWIWTVHRIYCALGGYFGWCFWGCILHDPVHLTMPNLSTHRIAAQIGNPYYAGLPGGGGPGQQGVAGNGGNVNQWLHGDTEGKSLKSLLFRGRVI